MDSFSLTKFENKQSCPATLHNSNEVSFEQPLRKYSMVDFSHKINIDQVMVDIKLTPLKSNEFSDKIKQIYQCLNYIKNLSPSLLQQVRTAQLIIQNIENKFSKHNAMTKRTTQQNSLNQSGKRPFQNSLFPQPNTPYTEAKSLSKQVQQSSQKKSQEHCLQSTKKPSSNILSTICGNDVSPIKILDETTSRIVYTNFSIKQIENSCKKNQSNNKCSPIQYQNTQHNRSNTQSNRKLSLVNQSQSSNNIRQQSSGKNARQQSMSKLRQQSNCKNMRQQSGSKCKSYHKKTESNFTVSNFDAQDEEMERLTKNIQALDRVLQQKGLCLRNDCQIDFNKKRNPLKENNLNVFKHFMQKSDKKPLTFNNKQRVSSNNKENW